MYEKHFGLSKNPFQSLAEGDGVFEGSEQTKVIAALKIALTARDSIAVITGPVGVGKTTIVQRAMEKMGSERLVAILGRTQVGSDELVDLLLAQFGVVREPTKRFECLKTFNRILNDRAEPGERLLTVIEDAERLGAELLEELEALTASDGGACAGANIILMGPQKLDKLITRPSLERVRQRIRLQQTLERFTAEECEAYLRHRIKAAGGDFDAMFEAGASLMVRRCSGGIPRVINSLCETALTVAAESKVPQVSGKIVFKVAVEVFGMSPGDAPASQAPRTTPGPMPPATKPPLPTAQPPLPTAQPPLPVAQPPSPVAKPTTPAAKPTTPAPQQATPAKTTAPAPQAAAAKSPAPAPQPAAAAKASAPAAKKPAPVANEPASVAVSPIPPAEEVVESTIRVPKLDTAAEPANEAPQASPPRAPKPPSNIKVSPTMPAATNGAAGPALKPNADAARLPDLPGLGVENKAPATEAAKPAAKPAANKPLPELPPKFKFADEIVVDRDTKPKLPVPGALKADLPELPTLKVDEGKPKTADDIPTLGDSVRVEKIAPEVKKVEEKPAAKPAPPTPASPQPAPSLAEPSPPAARSQADDDPTASFAKVDHDMLDAALADLAVHDEEDKPNSVEAEMIAAADEPAAAPAPTADPTPELIPEVTLDKSIEAKQAEAKAATDPEELNRMAAELEKTQSLEEMSDQLAETLFGSEELEAISLQIREETAPEEESPIALEPTDLPSAASPVASPPAAKAAMFARASSRARDKSPPCACSAPQQSCPCTGTTS